MESGHLSSAPRVSDGLRPGLIDLEDIRLVPTDQVESYWPFAARWLALACEAGMDDWTVARAFEACQSGQNQLLVAVRDGEVIAAATVAIVQKPYGKMLYIILCGGYDLWTWRDAMLEAFILWGNSQECVRMRIIGRAGWARVAGFRPVATVMERSL
jgi:hypothetical protein